MLIKHKRAGKKDQDLLESLESNAFEHSNQKNSWQDLLGDKNWFCYLASSEENTPLSYLLAHKAHDEMELYYLYTHPKYRNQGIALDLLDNLIADARKKKISAIWLEVRPSNKQAIHVYKKSGFTIEGLRKAHYRDNREDAWLMRQTLSK